MYVKLMLRIKVVIKNLFLFYIFIFKDIFFILKVRLIFNFFENKLLVIKIKIYD